MKNLWDSIQCQINCSNQKKILHVSLRCRLFNSIFKCGKAPLGCSKMITFLIPPSGIPTVLFTRPLYKRSKNTGNPKCRRASRQWNAIDLFKPTKAYYKKGVNASIKY